MDLAIQLVPLLGVIIGAVATYIVSARGEQRRYNRELKERWDRNKLDACAEYLSIIVLMARRAGQVAGSRGYDPLAAKIDIVEGLRLLDEAEVRRTVAFERVVLLGDEQTAVAAHHLNDCVWEMEWLARDLQLPGSKQPPGSVARWKKARDNYVAALSAFHGQARKALAVPGSPNLSRRVSSPDGTY